MRGNNAMSFVAVPRLTRKGLPFLWRKDCADDTEFSRLQAVRGHLSGIARRRRNRERDRLIIRLRGFGLKLLAVAMHCKCSVPTVWRVLQAVPPRPYPTVPAVLWRLFHGVPVEGHTLFTNRLSGGKRDFIEEQKIEIPCIRQDISGADSSHCPCCGRLLHSLGNDANGELRR